jgi:aryl-alcohol dehydrogenase-like predicted oxidoreductase
MAFAPAPPPASLLARYRQLSPSAAVMVSPLCLGAMNFGEAWKAFMGECTKETVFAILDEFHSMGTY